MEAHGVGLSGAYDRIKQMLMLETDRPQALREALMACRNGGTVSVPGVYGGFADKLPIGSVMNHSLTLKTGQTHVHRYLHALPKRIQEGDFDPEKIITHGMRLDDAPHAYKMFRDKQDGRVKVVLKPGVH